MSTALAIIATWAATSAALGIASVAISLYYERQEERRARAEHRHHVIPSEDWQWPPRDRKDDPHV